MTCIAGVVENGRVHIGADSAGIESWNVTIRKDPKVFRRGEMIFGVAGSFRVNQLLRYSLKIPKHIKGVSDHKYLCTVFADAVRDCLKAGGSAKKKEEEEEFNALFLLGYRGHLYGFESDYQVAMVHENYSAFGCGKIPALGSLYSTDHLHPETRIKKALKASEHFNMGVRGPFKIISGADAKTNG